MSDTSTLGEIERIIHARFSDERPADTDLAQFIQERFTYNAVLSLALARGFLTEWDAFLRQPSTCPQCNGDELGLLPSGLSLCGRGHIWQREDQRATDAPRMNRASG